MTTRPQPSDPLSALTRADGTTEAHSIDHGRVIGLHDNVKHYGAVGDGVANDLPALQAAHDAPGVGPVFLPQGTYKIPDGEHLTLKKPMYGVSRTSSVITCKNAWGLWSGTGQEIWLHHFAIQQRSGSTSGGCLMVGNLPGGPGEGGGYNYHTGWYIRDLYFTGVSTSPDPMVWMDGLVGGWIEHCQFAGDAPKGLLITAYFYSNIVGIYNNSFANNNTVAANPYGYGSEFNGNDYFIYGNDWENPARGLVLNTSSATVMSNWFEAVDETNLELRGSYNWIVENRFHQHKKVMTNTTHIKVRGGNSGYQEITNAVWNGDGTVTFTTDQPHGLSASIDVTVTRVVPAGFNSGVNPYNVATTPTSTTWTTVETIADPGTFVSKGLWGVFAGNGGHWIEKNKIVDGALVTVDVGPGTTAAYRDDVNARWENADLVSDGGLSLPDRTPLWMANTASGSRYGGLFAGDHGRFVLYGDPHDGTSSLTTGYAQQVFSIRPAGDYSDWPSAPNMPESVFAVTRGGYVVFSDYTSSGTPIDDGSYLPVKSWFFYWDTATERIGIKWRGAGFNNSLIPLPAAATTWTANQTFPAVKVQSGQGANAGIHFRNAADVSIFSGGGGPEGVYTAPPGSLYLDEGGAAYIKVTGTGNTGWKAITHA